MPSIHLRYSSIRIGDLHTTVLDTANLQARIGQGLHIHNPHLENTDHILALLDLDKPAGSMQRAYLRLMAMVTPLRPYLVRASDRERYLPVRHLGKP